MNSDYQVKTETFEGPLELLLDLVEKRKLFINEISLATVADDYIAHLKSFEKLPVDFVSSFLIVASTLILIKSKSLLPTLDLTVEEKQDIEELESRLKEYQRIREAVFAPSEEIKAPSIFDAMREVIARFPKKVSLPKVIVKKVISLEEVMDKLAERITSNFKMSFREFAGVGKEEKVNVIVSFLAMLELVKQGMISVTQDEQSADIHMETTTLDTPKYGFSGQVG